MSKRTIALTLMGGLNNAVDAANIRPSELSDCLNLDYSQHDSGQTRRGFTKINTTRYKDAANNVFKVLGLTSFAYGTGLYRDVFVGRASGADIELRYVSGNTATKVTLANTISIGSNDWPFTFVNINNRLLCLNGDTTNFIWDGQAANSAYALGIAKPGSVATLAEGAAGNLTGTYKYKFIFYDSTRDVEGEISDATSSITVSGKKIDLSNIPTTTDPRVDKVIILRTKSTGEAPYRQVAQINEGTTTYTDNITDAALGVERLGGGQPPNCRFGFAMNGVVYLLHSPSDGNYSRLYFSDPGRPEEFRSGNYIDMDSGDGFQGTGLYAVANQLIPAKERKLMHVSGNTADTYQIQTIAQLGQRWPYAGAQVLNDLFFASDDGIYRYDTRFQIRIENETKDFPPQKTYDAVKNPDGSLQANYGKEPVMVHNWQRRQLWFSYMETDGASANEKTLVYNYGSRGVQWSIYDFGFDVAGFWRSNFSGLPTLVFASRDMNGFVLQADAGNNDGANEGGTYNGTATAADATSITDSSAAFYTTNDGLIGVMVLVKSATTGATQRARITANTATKLTVASWPDFTPAAGDTYAVAPVRTYFKSARFSLRQPEKTKLARELRIRWDQAQGGSYSSTGTLLDNADFKVYYNGSSTAATSKTDVALGQAKQLTSLRDTNGIGKDFQVELDFYSNDGGKRFLDFQIDAVISGRRP